MSTRRMNTTVSAVPSQQLVSRERRGTALVLVLIAIVVLAVLSTGAILSTMQELRAAHNEQMSQRALTVAEYGLNQQLANWTSARSTMANGAIDSSTISIASGDTASVKVMRLNSRTFWIVSIGRTNRSSGRLEAQRQVSMLVNLSSASKTAPAVITSFSAVTIKGSAYVTGKNTNPPGWLGCPAANDTFAVAYNPSTSISIQKPATQSIGGTNADPNAAIPSFYTTFGNETYASLAAKANVTTSGTQHPSPVGTLLTCTHNSSNWGEPSRSLGAVIGCQGYFPIVYSSGNLSINGNSSGQGILLVDGDLNLNGTFDYVGLIVVKGNVKANGNFTLYGAILAGGTMDATSGNSSFYYSPCGVTNALQGLSMPARTKQRAWAQIYQ